MNTLDYHASFHAVVGVVQLGAGYSAFEGGFETILQQGVIGYTSSTLVKQCLVNEIIANQFMIP